MVKTEERFETMLMKCGLRIAAIVGMFMFATVAGMPFCTRAADVDFLEKLIAIPSVTANIAEVNRATRCMRDYLAERGVYCVIETMEDGREVLYAATTSGKRHDFVFSVHLDVVPPGKPGQFTLKRSGDRLEGRGVRDCKGNAVVAAEVLCELVGKNISVGCVFGPDEEIGGAGTRWMVEEKGYAPNRMAIVIDAGYGKVSYAQKGQTYVRIKAKGRSGHSSRPWDSDDSITKLMQAYVKIREIWDRRHPLPEDKWSDVMVPTYVKADSGALNLIPGEVELVLNLRSVNPGAKDELAKLAQEVSACEVEVPRHSPPVNCDPNHPLLKRLQSVMSETIGKEIGLGRMLAATDARWFVRCGVPIAMIGPAGGGAHSVDEYQTVSSLDEMKAYLVKFLVQEGTVR